MGKMSEVHIKMMEEDFYGDPDAYLKAYANKTKCMATGVTGEILCPNCFKDKLVRINKVDMSCMKCGHDFVYIETHNTVKFK